MFLADIASRKQAPVLITQEYIYRDGGWTPTLQSDLDSDDTLVLGFGAPEFKAEDGIWSSLRAAFPKAKILGCSTAGEIQGARVFDASVSVTVTRFAKTRLRQANAKAGQFETSFDAGRELAEQFDLDGLKAVLLFSDGQFVNGSELLRGIYEILPKSVKISGGLAADGTRFGPTWVLSQNGPENGRVSAVGFYGDYIDVSSSCEGGWVRFGMQRRVTRAEGSVLYELDGKPALQLYKEYLGAKSSELPASALFFPLELRRAGSDASANERQVMRTVLSIDEKAQSITFAGDIPVGSTVRLTRANIDKIVACAGTAAEAAAANTVVDESSLLVTVSCVGRRLVLKDRTEEELEATLSAVPKGVRQIGFYSYGEIAPFDGGTISDLHNQTMTVTLLHER